MTSEDRLIQKMEQGDAGAADELIGIYYDEILRYCLWHVPNRSLAEDAAQETFLKVIRYFDRYTNRGRFRAFLYQIAANTCSDMRRRNRSPDVSLEEAGVDPPYAEPGFEDVQSDMALRQLTDALPAQQREIVLLRFGQDLTMREIAEVTGLPLRTAQSRLRAALKRLKKDFAQKGRLL